MQLHVQANYVKFLLEHTGLEKEPLFVEHEQALLKLGLDFKDFALNLF